LVLLLCLALAEMLTQTLISGTSLKNNIACQTW